MNAGGIGQGFALPYGSIMRAGVRKNAAAKKDEEFPKAEEAAKERYGKVDAQDEAERKKDSDSETNSQILVKPDGSRVLVVTMKVGGMETTMSMEVSKPTSLPLMNDGGGETGDISTAE